MSAWGNISTKWDNSESLINIEKDTDDSGVEEKFDESYKKFIEKTYQVINHIEEIGMPQKNEQIRIVTFRSFNTVHFINYIAKKEIIEHLVLAVYSINAEAARFINDMINEGLIQKATILMSNLRNKAHREKEQITRDLFVNNPKVDLFFLQSHAKIVAMKTIDDNYYAIEGSGNLSYNSRVEQYVIDNDEGFYNFTVNWMQKVRELLKGKKELIET